MITWVKRRGRHGLVARSCHGRGGSSGGSSNGSSSGSSGGSSGGGSSELGSDRLGL